MSNHTGSVRLCQQRAQVPRPETTPPPLDSIDRRLVQRYGTWLLTGGYTALPTDAWIYYARLGVTEAEMVCLAQLCTYWWSARDPYPGEAALATRMGKSVRTIQGYLRSLEGKRGYCTYRLDYPLTADNPRTPTTCARSSRPSKGSPGSTACSPPTTRHPRRRRRRPATTIHVMWGYVTITTGHRGTRNRSRYVQTPRVMDPKTPRRATPQPTRVGMKDRVQQG